MKSPVLAALALALPLASMPLAAAGAQTGRAVTPKPLSITMTDQGFVPGRIVVQRGAPYVLRIVNRSRQGHNLSQKAFFRLARVDPQDRVWTRTGTVSLDPGQSALIRFSAPTTRPGGRFEFSSTVLGDAGKDYTGAFLIR